MATYRLTRKPAPNLAPLPEQERVKDMALAMRVCDPFSCPGNFSASRTFELNQDRSFDAEAWQDAEEAAKA
jgi:hypothetical protein